MIEKKSWSWTLARSIGGRKKCREKVVKRARVPLCESDDDVDEGAEEGGVNVRERERRRLWSAQQKAETTGALIEKDCNIMSKQRERERLWKVRADHSAFGKKGRKNARTLLFSNSFYSSVAL
jgi:hypothetical protein